MGVQLTLSFKCDGDFFQMVWQNARLERENKNYAKKKKSSFVCFLNLRLK